jgi:hypothetical protein
LAPLRLLEVNAKSSSTKALGSDPARSVSSWPLQVDAQVLDLLLLEIAELLGELQRDDVDGRVRRDAHAGDERLPAELRGVLAQLRERHAVVDVLRLAALDTRHVLIGDGGLDAHDRLRALLRQTGELEHLAHVRDVRGADVVGLLALVEVVITVGKTEPALIELADHLRGVLVILAGSEADQRVEAELVERADRRGEVLALLHVVDGGERLAERLEARLLDAGLVHAGRPVVGELLRVRVARVLPSGVVVEHLLEELLIALVDLGEAAAPRRFVVGDGRVLDPGAARVRVEVVARVDALIDRALVHADRTLRDRRRRRGCLLGDDGCGRHRDGSPHRRPR